MLAGLAEGSGLELAQFLAIGGVEETDMPVTAGHRQSFSIRAEGNGINAAFGDVEPGEFFHAAGKEFIELLHFAGVAIPRALGLDGFDVGGHFLGNIGGEDHNLSGAIKAAARGKSRAGSVKANIKHTTAHLREFAQEVGVIANYALGLAEDAE